MSEQDSFSRISDIVRLGDEDATVQVLSQAVLGLWEVVNNLTRLRPTRRQRYRVTIFGSARTDPGHWAYADRQAWGRKAVLNVARSGKFSSDRTITEYAESIWGATPCPVSWPDPSGSSRTS